MEEKDVILRQAAIDAFDGVKVDEEDCTEYDIGYNDGIDFAVSTLSVLPSADSPMIKPICPFRVERIESHTKVDEFTDKFVPCMRKRCPCYIAEADAEWCYREYLRFPLNEKARKLVEE